MNENILQVIKELREKSKKRSFPQSFDLIINLREFDTKKPENKITEDIILPHGRGVEANVIVFSDSLKDVGCDVLNSSNVEKFIKNKREGRKLVKSTDFFLSEPKLMPLVGKALGAYLGPKGKMPKLLVGDTKKMVDGYKRSVRVRIKDAPVVQCLVGKESMKDEMIVENIEAVLEHLKSKMPKGKHNFDKIFLKMTMSKHIQIKV